MLGTLGFRAQETYVLNGAVAASLTAKDGALGDIFDKAQQQPAHRHPVDGFGQYAV
jgi:hypothetical protein